MTTQTPTPVADRALAPDLARGAMLLLIALANIHIYLHGHPLGIRGYPLGQPLPDQLVTALQMTFVDGRAYPLFAALFGYGIVQLTRRRAADDVRAAVRLVRRRGRWMLLFGFGHALLLFSGDVIGAYGLLAVLLAGLLLRASDRTLLVAASAWLLLGALAGALQNLPVPGTTTLVPSMGTESPLVAVAYRVPEWLGLTILQALLASAPALLIGVWAARKQILDDPTRWRFTLRVIATIGLAVGALGGLPLALIAAGFVDVDGAATIAALGALHAVSGYAAGVGYAAVAGLVAIRVSRAAPSPVAGAIAACGQRSMTCYLWQSVVFVALLPAWSGGLGDRVGVATAALIAVGTWLSGVGIAVALARAGRRGPFEVALRRLVYR